MSRHRTLRSWAALPAAARAARTGTRSPRSLLAARATRTRSRRSLAAAALATLVAACLLSACGSGGAAAPSAQAGLVTAPPVPAGVSTLTPGAAASASASAGTSPGTSTSPAPNCNPVASLRPTGPLPAAGHMPAGSTMARIEQRGYLLVGVDQDSYLFGYRNPASAPGQPPVVGFDVDMLHQVAQAIFGDPNRIRYRLITQAERINAITSGEVDIVADSMTMTCQRETEVDFSTDYFDAGQRLLVDAASPVAGIQDLAGKKVCAAAGTTSIQTLADPAYHLVPVSAVNWSDCLVLLEQGQVDAVSTDDSILAGLELQDPYTKIVGPRFTQEPHGLAISKSAPDFVRFVNAVLARMRSDGTWTALYEQWIGTRLGPVPPPPPATYLD